MDNSKWFKWCERIVFIFLGYIITQISPPLFTDIYNVTLKKWFFEGGGSGDEERKRGDLNENIIG